MNIKTILATATLALAVSFAATTASAHGDEKHKKLEILKDNGKAFEKGMKEFSKGLGVKCSACHVKGDFASNDVAAKKDGRTFFAAVVGEKDQAKKDAALATLLTAMKIEKAKKPASIWAGVAKFEKK